MTIDLSQKLKDPRLSNKQQPNDLARKLSHIDEVISDPLRFKSKLAIGEDAYKILQVKNKVSQVFDTAGAVGTGVGIAKSAIVAETFFASTSFWSFLGIGSAVTPIGWVIAAGAVSGIAWHTVTKKSREVSDEMVTTIPHFINTPIDALGISLFSLIAPLALKIAHIDQEIHNLERDRIFRYLRREWGFSTEFLKVGLGEIENCIDQYYIKDLSNNLIAFTKKNPDCNPKMITRDILQLLREVMHADGVIDPREEQWISNIEVWITGKSTQKSLNKFF